MPKLEGKGIEKRFIELTGMHGKFVLPNKSVTVKFFSTSASSKRETSHNYDLLKELKPMRERVEASNLANLDTLLQRDLNDFRVANDLIPYLLNEFPPIAFFPAILAVLIPKDFLLTNEETFYPKEEIIEDEEGFSRILNYGNLWKLGLLELDGNESDLGILKIDPEEVHTVVLDGQHRANAFRVATGVFGEDNSNEIYSSFYRDFDQKGERNNFDADLPVTIIWFSREEPNFDPKIVSRRLFVDVNNSAKKVSKSRTILLDEQEIPSLMTRFFYSEIAEKRNFESGNFSLLHSDFDLDSDIDVSSNNAFALTNPQIVFDIFSWLTLSTDYYDSVSKYSVGREAFRGSLSTFGSIFDTETFNEGDLSIEVDLYDTKKVIIEDPKKIPAFEQVFKEILSNVVLNFFSNFTFFKKHYEAASKIEEILGTEEYDHVYDIVWSDIFKGGEGLYYTFKDKRIRRKDEATLNKYLKAIDEIENKFRELRASFFEDVDVRKVNIAFDSANSKAFQIAIFMALRIYKEDESFKEIFPIYLNKLTQKSLSSWVFILSDIRKKIVKSTDPKKWPTYKNLVLRLIQSEDKIYYDSENYLESPDGKVFSDRLEELYNSWLELNEDLDFDDLSIDNIGQDVVVEWIENSKNFTEDLFRKAEIEPIEHVDYKKEGYYVVAEFIKSTVS